MSVVVPQPSVPRYCAIVVVKPPEFEKIATDPFSSTSSGLSPPSAPPMRTRFQESATPRQLAPNMSMPLACPSARISRASCTEIFSDHHNLFQARVDADQLGDPVTHAGGRQVHDTGVELVPVIKPFAHIVVDGNIASRRRQHLAAPTRRSPEDHVPAGKCVADRRHLSRFAAENVEDADPIFAPGDAVERADAEIIGKTLDAL